MYNTDDKNEGYADENYFLGSRNKSVHVSEKISNDDISSLEMPFGEILIYNLDENGFSLRKEVRKIK